MANWRTSAKDSVTDTEIKSHPKHSFEAENQFHRIIPESFKSKINFDNPQDPLLLQVLPNKEELIDDPEFLFDAVDDLKSNPAPGVIHKYKSRILLITTGACAINCRYCFRRHFPYSSNFASSNHWKKSIEYISKTKTVNEVILSGGDPLMLSTARLIELTDQLQKLKHIKTLRIHSRMLTATPKRITANFLHWLKSVELKKVLVTHVNHPNELSQDNFIALQKLKQTDVTLLNQSVLLKNINDSVDTLEQLSNKLFEFGILPYYINLLDKVKGSRHFDSEDQTIKELIKLLAERLPGYLMPKFVKDIKNKKNKYSIFV